MCRVVRSAAVEAKETERLKRQNLSLRYSGRLVLHGSHVLSVPGVLEVGGPKGSRMPGQEFTIVGVYCCPAHETGPFQHATRAYLRTRTDSAEYDETPAWMACTQFLFRGHETAEGAKPDSHVDRSYGGSTQRTYHWDDAVIWKDMIVHIGSRPPTRTQAATFIVPTLNRDKRRASTRVYRAGETCPNNDRYFVGAYVPMPQT